jgi:hypothetical protein
MDSLGPTTFMQINSDYGCDWPTKRSNGGRFGFRGSILHLPERGNDTGSLNNVSTFTGQCAVALCV